MREIKFRAWSQEEKKMQYFDLFDIALNYDGGYCYGCDFRFDIFDDATSCTYDEEYNAVYDKKYNAEIMQYTGLKDKNGVEIYEGDKVFWGNNDIDIVEFKQGGFEPFVIKHWECEGEPEWCEVIGNIHEVTV